MKLTPVQYRAYMSLSYEWQTLYDLMRQGGNKITLDKLVELGYAERKLGLHSWSYRKANKRIMAG